MTEVAYEEFRRHRLYRVQRCCAAIASWSHVVAAPGYRGPAQRRTITSAGYVNGKFDVKAVERPAELVQAADLIFVAIPAHAQKGRLTRCCRT